MIERRELTPLERGERASFVWMEFAVELEWSESSARPRCARGERAGSSGDASNREVTPRE